VSLCSAKFAVENKERTLVSVKYTVHVGAGVTVVRLQLRTGRLQDDPEE
jgi:hypothetical protein